MRFFINLNLKLNPLLFLLSLLLSHLDLELDLVTILKADYLRIYLLKLKEFTG